jgi:hypothetical protein
MKTLYRASESAELECYHNREMRIQIDSSVVLHSVPIDKYVCDPNHERLVYSRQLENQCVYVASAYDLQEV